MSREEDILNNAADDEDLEDAEQELEEDELAAEPCGDLTFRLSVSCRRSLSLSRAEGVDADVDVEELPPPLPRLRCRRAVVLSLSRSEALEACFETMPLV